MYSQKEILSAKDIQNILGISRGTAYNLFSRRDFPTIQIGKRKLVSSQRFYEWLDKQTREEK